jgi:SOS-response transcriptional repressor LexA
MKLSRISSTNGVACHLKALKQKGEIEWDKSKSRSIVLTNVEGYYSKANKYVNRAMLLSPREKAVAKRAFIAGAKSI